jgi:hypothetical protein
MFGVWVRTGDSPYFRAFNSLETIIIILVLSVVIFIFPENVWGGEVGACVVRLYTHTTVTDVLRLLAVVL